MIALLLAAQVAGTAAPSARPQDVVPVPPAPAAPGLPRLSPSGAMAPLDCNQLARQISFRGRGDFQRLDQLPMGGFQYAVIRTIRGCPVPAPIDYHPTYLLPGAADAPAAKREDGPSNRR